MSRARTVVQPAQVRLEGQPYFGPKPVRRGDLLFGRNSHCICVVSPGIDLRVHFHATGDRCPQSWASTARDHVILNKWQPVCVGHACCAAGYPQRTPPHGIRVSKSPTSSCKWVLWRCPSLGTVSVGRLRHRLSRGADQTFTPEGLLAANGWVQGTGSSNSSPVLVLRSVTRCLGVCS